MRSGFSIRSIWRPTRRSGDQSSDPAQSAEFVERAGLESQANPLLQPRQIGGAADRRIQICRYLSLKAVLQDLKQSFGLAFSPALDLALDLALGESASLYVGHVRHLFLLLKTGQFFFQLLL